MSKQPFENVVQYLFQIASQTEFKTLNDQELLKRYVEQGDELAFGELLRRYKGMVWYVCWNVLRQHQDVEDAFQATVMTLIHRAKTILGRETIEGWLHKTAFKVASAAKRGRERRHAREERVAKMRNETFESGSNQLELREIIDRNIISIPEKFRSPLILCYLQGLTQRQAAEKLGIPVDSLEWRLQEGRERLKKKLSKHGLDLGIIMPIVGVAQSIDIPAIPPDLVEKTLDMVRIMTLATGALETAGISPQVATLVKGAMGMTLKVKLLLGSLLLSLVVVTAGAAKYAGILHLPTDTQRQEGRLDPANKLPEEPKPDKTPPRKDLYGDPLPLGALNRLGTVRLRNPHGFDRERAEIIFTPDSQSIGLLWTDKAPLLWNMKTGEPVHRLGDRLQGQPFASSYTEKVLSPDGRLMAYRTTDHRGENFKIRIQEVTTGKLVRDLEQGGYSDGLAFSPDGQSLVATATDITKDQKTGKVLRAERKLCLYEIATGQRGWEQKMKEKRFRLAFSPNGKIVALGYTHAPKPNAKDGNIELRNARTGQFLKTLGLPRKVNSFFGGISFSPDGRTLAAVYDHDPEQACSVYLWDVDTGKERWHLGKEHHYFSYPAFSPDSKLIALCDQRALCKEGFFYHDVGLYDVVTGKRVVSCPQHEVIMLGSNDNRLVFSPDGKTLASIRGQGYLIRCWEVATGKILAHPTFGHESAAVSVAFTADGHSLVSGGANQSVHFWDFITGQKLRTISEESSRRSLHNKNLATPIIAPAVSAYGKIVAGIHIDTPAPNQKLALIATIYIWEAATGRELRKLPLELLSFAEYPCELALTPDGKFLAAWKSAGDANIVTLWEVATGKLIVEKIEGAYPRFSPDSSSLLTYKDGVFTLWKAKTGQKISAVTGVDFKEKPGLMATPDWQTLACLSFDKKNQKPSWYVSSLHLNQQAPLTLGRPSYLDAPNSQEIIIGSALSPDGRMLAWARRSTSKPIIHVLETATGAERIRFEGHTGAIESLSFSPDGRRLASGSDDTTILVWDVTGGWFDERGHRRSVRLSAARVQQLWDDLAGTDAVQAGRAMWTLAAAPPQAIPFLAKHLAPIVVKNQPSAGRIAQLIADLDSEKYAVRQKAFIELSKLGAAAEAGIQQALKKQQPLEVGRRLKLLLAAIEDQRKGPSKAEFQCLRALEVLERIGSPEACRILEILSQGSPGIRQTREAQAALQRLQRSMTPRSTDPR